MDASALTQMLYRESGLLGVSGISQDMRELLASDRAEAAEAVDLFCYRIVREIGSLAAAIGGLDALVFTSDIGERAAAVRQKVCRQLDRFGLELDETADVADAVWMSTAESHVAAFMLPIKEEWMPAWHAGQLIASPAASPTLQ